ncbi:MAG: segregation and condensation protein [Patescibacteria group bacterium]|nr:segregation and condensation protein [Patescibacteria group bacterium]
MMEFKTEKFSGPLGLLLSLIESEKMDITEINLAQIADEYVAHLKELETIDPEELSDFLVVAAKLLHIKSKALLPYLVIDEEEDEGVDLERQLRMYKEFVIASKKIETILLEAGRLFIPETNKPRRFQKESVRFLPPAKITTGSLAAGYRTLLQELTKELEKRLPEERLAPKINIEEKIFLIKKLLIEKNRFNFSQLISQTSDKIDKIVSFLAILELAKQEQLSFEQSELFSEIHILKNNLKTD